MKWELRIKEYKNFLLLEKSLSANTVEAYIRDVTKITEFLGYMKKDIEPEDITTGDLNTFIGWINEINIFHLSASKQNIKMTFFCFKFYYL